MTSTDGYTPISCCSPSSGVVFGIICGTDTLNITGQFPNTLTVSDPYETGCLESFGDFVKSHAVTLGGAGIAIAMIQVMMMTFDAIYGLIMNGFFLFSADWDWFFVFLVEKTP